MPSSRQPRRPLHSGSTQTEIQTTPLEESSRDIENAVQQNVDTNNPSPRRPQHVCQRPLISPRNPLPASLPQKNLLPLIFSVYLRLPSAPSVLIFSPIASCLHRCLRLPFAPSQLQPTRADHGPPAYPQPSSFAICKFAICYLQQRRRQTRQLTPLALVQRHVPHNTQPLHLLNRVRQTIARRVQIRVVDLLDIAGQHDLGAIADA